MLKLPQMEIAWRLRQVQPTTDNPHALMRWANVVMRYAERYEREDPDFDRAWFVSSCDRRIMREMQEERYGRVALAEA